MLSHSHGFEKVDAFTVRFDVPVPAGGETTLRYRMRVRFEAVSGSATGGLGGTPPSPLCAGRL